MHNPKVIKVSISESLIGSDYIGPIYGYYHPKTKYYNIVSTDKEEGTNLLGYIMGSDDIKMKSSHIYGLRVKDKIIFKKGEEEECELIPYSLITDIFSRNVGILETSLMMNKSVIVSGCGSVGSLVALELARAGVGSFFLIDNDILSYHNICRHQCGTTEVGTLKVDAVKKRIMEINPSAKVRVFSDIIERVSKEDFEAFIKSKSDAIIIGCADNREGDLHANKVAKFYGIPFISIGLWERAAIGEIFYTLNESTPCYECFCQVNGISTERQTTSNKVFYTTEEDLEKTNFEPGISIDISFVTIIGIKLILDILNRVEEEYIPKVIKSLSQFTLICNTNNTKIAGDMADIFSYPLQVTTSINVGFSGSCEESQRCEMFNRKKSVNSE